MVAALLGGANNLRARIAAVVEVVGVLDAKVAKEVPEGDGVAKVGPPRPRHP